MLGYWQFQQCYSLYHQRLLDYPRVPIATGASRVPTSGQLHFCEIDDSIKYYQSFPFALDLQESIAWDAICKFCDFGKHAVMIGLRALKNYIIQHPPGEVYDLESDPAEVRNSAGDKEHEAALKQLRNDLER